MLIIYTPISRINGISAMLAIILLVSSAGFCLAISEHESSPIPDLRYLDENINPCDDFYAFTCGNFPSVHPRPDKEPVWDNFAILQRDIHMLAKDILETERVPNERRALQKAKAFYTGCMDVLYAENLNSPQLDVLAKLGNWPVITERAEPSSAKLSWNQLAKITAIYGIPFMLAISAEPALFNGTQIAVTIQSDTLRNPEASGVRAELPTDPHSYLFAAVAATTESRENQGRVDLPYLKFLTRAAFHLRSLMHEHASDAHIVYELRETVDFMKNISTGDIVQHGTQVPVLSADLSVRKLQNWTDAIFGNDFINWTTYLNTLMQPAQSHVTDDTPLLISRAEDLFGILSLYKTSTASQLKNYVMARLLTHMAPDSHAFMRHEWELFAEANNSTVFSRDDYCVRKTLGYKSNIDFALAVTYAYQQFHFNINKLEKTAEMVSDLHEIFMDILSESSWMDDTSKSHALEKAKKMIAMIGYPDEIEDEAPLNKFYDSLKVCTWDHFGNSQRLRVFDQQRKFKEVGKSKRRNVWNVSPLVVNAFYYAGYNRILIPISILNPIFFNGDIAALDYGRLGAVIGHEIIHGFDMSGKNYDGDGTFQRTGWWTPETKDAFEKKAECFRKQFNAYYIDEIDSYVNGTNTMNENLADSGGLRVAYHAFQRWQQIDQDNRKAHSTTYTNEQLFFIGYGTMWCASETDRYKSIMNANGSYAPSKYRVIGAVSNMNEFAAAFHCPRGSKMNPVDKCVLW